MPDKPKAAALMTLGELRAILDFADTQGGVLMAAGLAGRIGTLTLDQLIAFKHAADKAGDVCAWLTTPGAEVEFRRIVDNEPHRHGLKLRIVRDDTASNPLDTDTLGEMACWHKRYTLGDEQPKCDPDEFTAELPEGTIVIPLYLYDHSGITIRTTPFSSRFDSGQVGIIYATPERIKNIFGEDTITDAIRDQVVNTLEAEVKTYNDFLTGNVWGFVLENEDGEHLDSCWGFYGDDKDGITCHLSDDAKGLLDAAWEKRGS